MNEKSESEGEKSQRTNISISELLENNPLLLKAYLSYFLSLSINKQDLNLLNFLFSMRTIDNTTTFDDFFLQCVQAGKAKMISFYLNKGQYPNIQNRQGETALHLAASNGDYELILFLQSFGVDKSIKNNQGLTAYDYAVEQGDERVIELLRPYKSYSVDLAESPNEKTQRKCITSRKAEKSANQAYVNNLLMEKTQNSQIETLISHQSDEYPPQIIIENTGSVAKLTCSKDFPIEYMKGNTNIVSNHRYCNGNDNINKTNEEIIDINKYTGLTTDNDNSNVKEESFLSRLHKEQRKAQTESDAKVKYQNQITEYFDTDTNQNHLKKTICLDLDENTIINSPFNIQLPNEQISFSSNIITNQICHTSTEKKSTSQTQPNNHCSFEPNDDVYLFLSEIQLEEYTLLLIKNGFDDIKLLVDQTRRSIAMTDQNLSDAGIRIAGDRAKILIHLEQKAGLFDFDFKKDHVYYKPNRLLSSMYRSDRHTQKFLRVLSSVKMEKYLNNFITSGYATIDLVLMQMLSRQPMTEQMLETEIKVDKIGYRARLITKFNEEAQGYKSKGRSKNILIDSQNNPSDFCHCVMY